MEELLTYFSMLPNVEENSALSLQSKSNIKSSYGFNNNEKNNHLYTCIKYTFHVA